MSLPMLTTIDDVRDLVKFLKNKPMGASLKEAKSIVKKQVLDPRKVNAYETWGVIAREGDRMKLTDIGWRLARKPEMEEDALRDCVRQVPLYKLAIEWAYNQDLATIRNVDIASFWHDHYREALASEKENTIKDNAVCFFHLAQGAGLGEFKIGRRGQPTRLELDMNSVAQFVNQGPASSFAAQDADELLQDSDEPSNEASSVAEQPESSNISAEEGFLDSPAADSHDTRVFISHGNNKDILDQVEIILDTLDIETKVAESEESTAIPVPHKVLTAMHDCTAAIIIVSVDENRKDSNGSFSLNENVLIEIGAAFVLYKERVVLLWDRRISVPSNLQGLYRSEFEGDELTWSAGMKLIKAVKEFRN